MATIIFSFGTRQEQDLPGYPSGPAATFYFSVQAEDLPGSHEDAMKLLHANRERFLSEILAERISCYWQPFEDRKSWIPNCYLTNPVSIEVQNNYSLISGRSLTNIRYAEEVRRRLPAMADHRFQ